MLSLSEHGLIGNRSTSALISRTGTIDWCCMPHLDSPSHFAGLLDEDEGGRFQLAPTGDFRTEQRYLSRTHVLETTYETPHGRAILTDWMPMEAELSSVPLIVRQLEMIEGRIEWQLSCAPNFGYSASPAKAERFRGGILFRGASSAELAQISASVPLEIGTNGASVSARFALGVGERARFRWGWGRARIDELQPSLEASVARWQALAHRCPERGCIFAGPWHDLVIRSQLLLKLLFTPFTGTLAESVTGGSGFGPGIMEGFPKWNARTTTLRESSFALQALAALDCRQEADDWFGWISETIERDGAEGLQSSYTLDGGRVLTERDLAGLPLRIGSGFLRQFQLDIYGHVVLAAAEHYQLFGRLSPSLWAKISEIADFVSRAWRRPDFGPWRTSPRPEHFTLSKLLCWSALDRACWLARVTGQTLSSRWMQERNILHQTICQQGYDTQNRTFVRAFGDREPDASALIIPLLRFLPPDDPRILGTLEWIQTHLSEGVFIHRSRSPETGFLSEGGHLPSSLHFISCLALSGRVDEASDRLAELCSYATPLGHFGDQINLKTGESAGAYPSSAVHLGLVNAALYVGMAHGRKLPVAPLIGMPDLLPMTPLMPHRAGAG